MDIITNYIESMFAGVPVNEQTMRLREDITANMCDKYDELVKEGKSVNEAIGTVISEFGNIDEVLIEMGISRSEPAPVRVDDPAAIHTTRIRLFGALAGIGSGFLVFGTGLVSPLSVRVGFWAGTEVFGLGFLSVGVMMLIISLLLRTKILVGCGSIPDTVIPYLKSAQDKSCKRHFRMKMIFGGIQILSFIIFAVNDLWVVYSRTGTFFMLTAVSAAFAVSVHILVSERTYTRVLGNDPKRLDSGNMIMFFSVPFFAVALMFSKFDSSFGSNESIYVMWGFVLLYMLVCVIAGMLDANRRNAEKQVAAAVLPQK